MPPKRSATAPDDAPPPITEGFRYGLLADQIYKDANLPANKQGLKRHINAELERLLEDFVPGYDDDKIRSSGTAPKVCVGTGDFTNTGRYFQRRVCALHDPFISNITLIIRPQLGSRQMTWLTKKIINPTFLDVEEIARLILAREELEVTRTNKNRPAKAGSFRRSLHYARIYNHFYYEHIKGPPANTPLPSLRRPPPPRFPLSPPSSGSRKRPHTRAVSSESPLNKRRRPALDDITATFITSRSPSPDNLPKYVFSTKSAKKSPDAEASFELMDSDAEKQSPEYAPPLLFLFWTEVRL